jgi:beta-lactamase regulating signal transducer with metallopeptidase domain
MKLSAQLSPDNDDAEPSSLEEQKFNANIPKSPSFHSGLDLLVAGSNNKYVNISKFNFANDDMNGNNKTSSSVSSAGDQQQQQQSNQQTIFSFSKVVIIDFFLFLAKLATTKLFFTVFLTIRRKSIE